MSITKQNVLLAHYLVYYKQEKRNCIHLLSNSTLLEEGKVGIVYLFSFPLPLSVPEDTKNSNSYFEMNK